MPHEIGLKQLARRQTGPDNLGPAAERVFRTKFRILRRAFDIACALAGVTLLSPLIAIIIIAIKLDDRGPVFYAQWRVGKNFCVFRVLKFRSMVPEADRQGLLTTPSDSRITRVGRFLRQYKLDELPQLFNVLKGDMQLVGPRPEVEQYVERFRLQYEILLRDRPGLTDPATLAYRREDEIFRESGLEQQYLSEMLPDKLRLSLDYQRRRNWLADIQVLTQTALALPGKSHRFV